MQTQDVIARQTSKSDFRKMLDQNYHTHNQINITAEDDLLVISENEYVTLHEQGPLVCDDGGTYTGQWLGK